MAFAKVVVGIPSELCKQENDVLLLRLSVVFQGAAAVAGAGIMQSICLPLLSVYQLSSNGAGQVGIPSSFCLGTLSETPPTPFAATVTQETP